MSRDISIDQWRAVEQHHPDIIGNYAELRLGAVISRRKTPESIAKRNQFNVISLIKRRYGFGEDKLGLGGLAELLDVSDSGVKNIVEAGVACISADSEVFLPHHRGKATFAEMERIRRVLEERRLLEDYLRSQSPLNRFQQKVVDHTLEGYSPQMIADVFNSEANLSHPTSEDIIWHFLESVYKRVERDDPARLERKSLKATEVLAKVESGDFENLKARASRDVLVLLEEGYQVPEIIAELALPKMHYRFLMRDVFMDLEGDPRGQLDLQAAINQVKRRSRTAAVGSKTINSIARRLLSPYDRYRGNLAEDQLGDRSSWDKVLSARERELVEAVA